MLSQNTALCDRNNGATKTTPHRDSSSSSTSSSSHSPFSPPHLHRTQPTKTMEEVWNDINLASLHDHPSVDQDLSAATPRLPRHHHNHNPHHSSNFILQDFFARPFNKDPQPRIVSTHVLPPPPPATVLSLNSAPGFDFVDSSDSLTRPASHLQNQNISNVFSLTSTSPFVGLDSASGECRSFGRKRVQESNGNSGDRRNKRMIKNRESAARSRARKQAYTNELELEVAHLLEENARLKRQQKELCLAAADQLPKKHTLYRTLTAPF